MESGRKANGRSWAGAGFGISAHSMSNVFAVEISRNSMKNKGFQPSRYRRANLADTTWQTGPPPAYRDIGSDFASGTTPPEELAKNSS